MLKTYETFSSISDVEQVICEEVMQSGFSEGWSGSSENFILIQKILEKKNIHYGYLGMWKPTIH